MKMVEVGEVNKGKEELIKRKKGKKADKGGSSVVFSEGKTKNFLGDKSDEMA